MTHFLNKNENITIEKVKPLVYKIHYKATKESFAVINYITDWHCKCPEHIETDNECKHIRLVKSWLGIYKRKFIFKKNDSIVGENLLKLEPKSGNVNNFGKPLPTHPPPDPNESIGKWIEKIGNANLIEFNIMLDYIMNYANEIGFEKTLHLLTRFPIENIIELENEFKEGFWKKYQECPIKECTYISRTKTNIVYHLATRHH